MKAANNGSKVLYNSQGFSSNKGQTRDLMVDYIVEKETISLRIDDNWNIITPPDLPSPSKP